MKTTRGLLIIAALLLATALMPPSPAGANYVYSISEGQTYTLDDLGIPTVNVTLSAIGGDAILSGTVVFAPSGDGAMWAKPIHENLPAVGMPTVRRYHMDGFNVSKIVFKSEKGYINIDFSFHY